MRRLSLTTVLFPLIVAFAPPTARAQDEGSPTATETIIRR
jgi:hypothetical protein